MTTKATLYTFLKSAKKQKCNNLKSISTMGKSDMALLARKMGFDPLMNRFAYNPAHDTSKSSESSGTRRPRRQGSTRPRTEEKEEVKENNETLQEAKKRLQDAHKKLQKKIDILGDVISQKGTEPSSNRKLTKLKEEFSEITTKIRDINRLLKAAKKKK